MKNYIYGMLIALFCFVHPLCANTSSSEFSLKLNHLTYTPIHQAQFIEDTLYLSAEDFAAITYGHYEKSEDTQTLTIQNTQITFTNQSRYIKVNHLSKLLSHPTYTQNHTTLLPIQVLDFIHYPYTYSKDQHSFDIVPLLPYSTATDTPSTHKTFSTQYKAFHEVFEPFLKESDTTNLIQSSIRQNYYVSLMNTTYKLDCLKALGEIAQQHKQDKLQTTVYFRQLNWSGQTPSLSHLTALPASYTVDNEGLHLTLGDKVSTHSIFWATYNPCLYSTPTIDLNKSLDVMIMRGIYAYYRDLYDLKDDAQSSPVLTVQMGRSDQMPFYIYSDTDPSHTPYQVVIYRMTTGHTVQYYVDLKPI